MPVVTTAEYVVISEGLPERPDIFWTDSDIVVMSKSGQTSDLGRTDHGRRLVSGAAAPRELRRFPVLIKVFPIKLKDGMQERAEAIVHEYAPIGPGAEEGTLSFRVYRDPANVDYLLLVEHFADKAAF